MCYTWDREQNTGLLQIFSLSGDKTGAEQGTDSEGGRQSELGGEGGGGMKK